MNKLLTCTSVAAQVVIAENGEQGLRTLDQICMATPLVITAKLGCGSACRGRAASAP